MRSRAPWFLLAAVAIGLAPLIFSSSYWQTNLIVCAINVLLAMGLDFVLGYAGQLNLGQSAFYGIGAYASTLLIMRLAVPFWIAFVLGVLLSGIAGVAVVAVRECGCADITLPSPRSGSPLSPIRCWSIGSVSPKDRLASTPSLHRRRSRYRACRRSFSATLAIFFI